MFPGANTARENAAYVVFGAPLDVSTSFQPGARFGPRRVREFAESFEDYDHRTGQSFTDRSVHDAGDLNAWSDVPEYLDFLEATVGDAIADGAVPLVVGGEHTVSLAGVRAVDPDVFVCLDAHLDLREQLAGDPLSHATVTRHALAVADRAVILGARAGSEAEWERAARADVTVVSPAEVPDWTLGDETEIDASDSLYLSVDIDAADPGFAPGTATMEPFGLAPRDLHRVVRELAPRATGFDLVEVNDRDDGQAAALGAKLLRAFVHAHADGERDGASKA